MYGIPWYTVVYYGVLWYAMVYYGNLVPRLQGRSLGTRLYCGILYSLP